MLQIKLEDIDGDGKHDDLVVEKDGKQFLSVRDIKMVVLEAVGTLCAVFGALASCHILGW